MNYQPGPVEAMSKATVYASSGAAVLLGLTANEIAIAQEKDREITRLATGRRCLDAAVVGLLNASTVDADDALPKAGGEPISADAAFATGYGPEPAETVTTPAVGDSTRLRISTGSD